MNSPDIITHDEIRQRAHQLWDRAGRPEGQDTLHWLQAEREVRAERDAASGDDESDAAPKPLSGPASEKASKIARKGEPLTPAGTPQRSPKQENL